MNFLGDPRVSGDSHQECKNRNSRISWRVCGETRGLPVGVMVDPVLWQTVRVSELFLATCAFQENLIRNVRFEIPEFVGVFPAFREVFMLVRW